MPVYRRFIADLLTPVSAFLRLQGLSERSFLLESVEGGEKTARFSFLGCRPVSTLRFSDGVIEEENGGRCRQVEGDLLAFLTERFRRYKVARPEGLPRFTGGAVGYLSYEMIRYFEDVPVRRAGKPVFPEALFMLFDTVLAFDHLRHEIYIIHNVFLDESGDSLAVKFEQALRRIDDIKQALEKPLLHPATTGSGAEVVSNFTRSAFCDAVAQAKEFIQAGDVFQVVLSQKFERPVNVPPFDIYRALRVVNPSPYLFFLKMGEMCIIGSSPELLVRVDEGVVEVRPIAGTRPRGKDEAEDSRLAEELRADEKEIAEHVMLVDLGRNDVGRVSEYGSVEVTELMVVEKYSHVMHLVSNVRGRLRPDLNALDALKACFPAGTVTGAPKIRAMQIISELEPEPRGVYAGALGYLDFSGNLDTCIAIRTIVTHGPRATFQAGAGIVADSVPEREFQETLHKAAALRAAIEFAERGLQ